MALKVDITKAMKKADCEYLMENHLMPADFMMLACFETLDYMFSSKIISELTNKWGPELEQWREKLIKMEFYAKFKAQTKPSLFAGWDHASNPL